MRHVWTRPSGCIRTTRLQNIWCLCEVWPQEQYLIVLCSGPDSCHTNLGRPTSVPSRILRLRLPARTAKCLQDFCVAMLMTVRLTRTRKHLRPCSTQLCVRLVMYLVMPQYARRAIRQEQLMKFKLLSVFYTLHRLDGHLLRCPAITAVTLFLPHCV